MMAAKTITPKELAQELGTDAKTLRKFLREWAPSREVDTPGQGGRWALTGRQAQEIRKAFSNRQTVRRSAKAENAEVEEVEDPEAEEVEDVYLDDEADDSEEELEDTEVEA